MKNLFLTFTIICALAILAALAVPSPTIISDTQVDPQPQLVQEIPQAPWMAFTPAQVASVAWNDRF